MSHTWRSHGEHLNFVGNAKVDELQRVAHLHVTHFKENESWHTFEWVNESCHTSASHLNLLSNVKVDELQPFAHHQNMPHIWMVYVAHIKDLCHIYEWVMSRIWITPRFALQCQSRWASALCSPSKNWQASSPHVPPFCRAPPAMSESCHTYKWVMSHTWISPMYHPLVVYHLP